MHSGVQYKTSWSQASPTISVRASRYITNTIFHLTKKTYFSKFSFSRIFSLYLVPGYDYSACGNSTSKKDSQANAAKDFIQYLLRQGQMLPNEVPDGCGMDQGGGAASGLPPMGGLGLNQRPVFQHG